MHFPIINFEEVDTRQEDWDVDLPFDDPTLLDNTDYYGELYTPEERDSVVQSEWLSELFKGIAKVDTITESIYFYDAVSIRNTIKEYFKRLTEELYDKAQKEELHSYELVWAGKNYKDSDTLFCYKGTGYTSFEFICDAEYYAEKTLRIGNIFDAHI